MDTRRTASWRAPLFTMFTLLTVAVAAGAQRSERLPERFAAFAVSAGGLRTQPIASEVEITINRWSTAEESQQLIRVLKDKGPEALLEALRGLKPVGTIQTPGSLAYDLHFGYQEPFGNGGRRIFLATDRPISYWEALNQPRTVSYPFTFIELRMNSNGEGEGKLALATQIHVNDAGTTIELENYRTQPINLTEVKRKED